MRQASRRFRGSYCSYVFIFFFTYFAMSTFSSVISVYLTGIGKTATEMSLIVSSGGMFSFVVVPFVGYLCDCFRRHTRLICAVLVLGMGALAFGFAFCRQVWSLFLLNGLVMSLLNATMPVSERLASVCKFRYGTLRVWGTLGYAAGAQAAGIAIQSFPSFVLFSAVTAATVLSAVGYLSAEDPTEHEPPAAPAPPTAPAPLTDLAPQTDRREGRAPLSSLLKNPQFLLYLVICFFCAGCSGVNMTYAPMLLNKLGMATGAVGTVLSLSTLVEIPIILFSNKFMDRFSGKFLLVVMFSIFIVQYLFYGLSDSLWVVVAAMVLLKAVASTLMMMIILKVVRNLVAPALTTTGLSVVTSVNNLGMIALQNAGGVLVDHTDIPTMYLGMAGLAALSLLLSLFLKVRNDEKVFG